MRFYIDATSFLLIKMAPNAPESHFLLQMVAKCCGQPLPAQLNPAKANSLVTRTTSDILFFLKTEKISFLNSNFDDLSFQLWIIT